MTDLLFCNGKIIRRPTTVIIGLSLSIFYSFLICSYDILFLVPVKQNWTATGTVSVTAYCSYNQDA